jgi:ribA/ribD-fused uncharacterized protein
MNKIYFYTSREVPYGVFSNFLRSHPITLKDKVWPSSEHYYQAQKFAGTEYEEAVRLLKTPREAADMGRRKDLPLRKDWDEVKNKIMVEAVYAKFTQYPHLKDILLKSGKDIIIEHTENDNYWADGGDGSGENWLGVILMALREELSLSSEEPNQII